MINHHDDDNGDDNDDNGDEHAEFVALVQVAGLPSPLVFHRSEKGKRGAGEPLGGTLDPGGHIGFLLQMLSQRSNLALELKGGMSG